MYKLWRRELSKPSSSDHSSKRKEGEFSVLMMQLIKCIRKKVLFLQIKPTFTTSYITDSAQVKTTGNFHRQHTSSGSGNSQTLNIGQSLTRLNNMVGQLQNEHEAMINEEDEIVGNLKRYEEEAFYLSKTYLYTMLVRLLQIFDFAKQRVELKVRNNQPVYNRNWDKHYEDSRTVLTQCYQNLVYFQNYNVVELASTAIKKQNQRIFSIVATKVKKNQISLKPLIRLNSTQIKKSQSIDVKPKKQDVQIVVNKKLAIKQKKLQTQKRMEERKKPKQKPVTIKHLYGALGIKVPKVQEGYAYRREMQLDCLQRNESIQQERKRWEKFCEQRSSMRG